jgi:hypothetical protein
MSLAELLLKDIFYKQDANDNYEFTKDNKFIENDINILISHIRDVLDNTFSDLSRTRPFLRSCKMYIDHISLKQALSKYARDVFGQRRLSALLTKSPNYQYILDNMGKFGIKINSLDPYIHRRVGCFFYWICMLKPFRIEIQKDITVPPNGQYIISYFNELCAYVMIKITLGGCKIENCIETNCEQNKKDVKKQKCCLTINLDKDRHLFQDFLYASHFRKLSRSSLELFLSRSCIIPFCPDANCPLTNINTRDLHRMFTLGLTQEKGS